MKFPLLIAASLYLIACESKRPNGAETPILDPVIVSHFPEYTKEKQERITQHVVDFLQQNIDKKQSIWVYVPAHRTPEGVVRLSHDSDGTHLLLVQLTPDDLSELLKHPVTDPRIIDEWYDPDYISLRSRSTECYDSEKMKVHPFNLFLDDRFPHIVYIQAISKDLDDKTLTDFSAAFYSPRVWQKIKKQYEMMGVEFSKTGSNVDGFVYKPSKKN